MYNSLRRWGGSKRPADTHARQLSADYHVGSYRDYLRRHECESADAAHGDAAKKQSFCGCLPRRVADSCNLRCAIDFLASEGGQAPGPNGRSLRGLGENERWELARALGQILRDKRYA